MIVRISSLLVAAVAMLPSVSAQERPCFQDKRELVVAVDAYLADPSPGSFVANQYGWPIGSWCVRDVEDFSYLFDAQRNPAARLFNEDLPWCTCSATNMR